MNERRTIIPAEVMQAKRKEREKQRREREALAGTILDDDDEEDDQPVCGVASERKGQTT